MRPATAADDDFCFLLHARAMREYVTATFGRWDDTEQESFHRSWFDPARLQIIENAWGDPIGVLDVMDKGDHLYLSRIELLPEWQGNGTSSAIVNGLTATAPVRLHVFVSNRRARALYERLGFIAEGTERGRTAMRHPGPAK